MLLPSAAQHMPLECGVTEVLASANLYLLLAITFSFTALYCALICSGDHRVHRIRLLRPARPRRKTPRA